jgi:hypothetical protein
MTVLIFLYPASFLFVVHDLMTWAIEKATLITLDLPRVISAADGGLYQRIDDPEHGGGEGDDEPKEPIWPRPAVMFFDALFAIVYQWIFWVAIAEIERAYYGYDSKTLKAYAALSAFVMSILHGKAFREELKARRKANMIRELEQTPCRQCGQVNPLVFKKKDDDEAENESARVFGLRKEQFGIPGWAKAFNERRNRASRGQRDDLEVGQSNDEDETESLVIGPTPEGSSKGYGTVSQSVHSLSGRGEELVKKKGLKRVIGEEWIVKSDTGIENGKGKGKAKVVEESDVGA